MLFSSAIKLWKICLFSKFPSKKMSIIAKKFKLHFIRWCNVNLQLFLMEELQPRSYLEVYYTQIVCPYNRNFVSVNTLYLDSCFLFPYRRFYLWLNIEHWNPDNFHKTLSIQKQEESKNNCMLSFVNHYCFARIFVM